MTEEEYLKTISNILEKMFEASPRGINIYGYLSENTNIEDTPGINELSNLSEKLHDKLLFENLAITNGEWNFNLKISEIGIGIVKNGGYLAYLDRQANEAKIIANRQIVADEHARWSLRQTKRQVKWFFPLTIVAFIGGVLSIYTTGISIVQQSNIDSLEIQAKSTQQSLDSLKKVYLIHTKTTKSK